MADAKVKITDETRKIDTLTHDPKNARRHSEAQIATIIASIEEFGFIHRVVIRPNGQLIAGHATLEALRKLGKKDIECRAVDGLSDAKYKKLGLALNKIPENSAWDDAILRELVGDMADVEDMGATGFTEKEIARLRAEPDPLEVREIETSQVSDEFWISIRGPLLHQAECLKAMETAMKKFSGCTVELGTIGIE